MTEYVAGFLFGDNGANVLLIEKTKPAWQKGKLNGIGGKIEPGETPDEAMPREFKEETDLDIDNWIPFVVLAGEKFRVHFYFAHTTNDVLVQARNTTEEQVRIVPTADLFELPVINNLRWLIPMALSMQGESVESFEIHEIQNEYRKAA